MTESPEREDRTDWTAADEWVEGTCGTPPAPGTPVGKTCNLPYEQIKHLLADVPLDWLDPRARTPTTARRRRAKRRDQG